MRREEEDLLFDEEMAECAEARARSRSLCEASARLCDLSRRMRLESAALRERLRMTGLANSGPTRLSM
jgi:hypothetical protein